MIEKDRFEIHVTDIFRVVALRQAMKKQQVVDVADDEGETIRGRVFAVHSVNDFLWRVEVVKEVIQK